jgi:hypothetical protein
VHSAANSMQARANANRFVPGFQAGSSWRHVVAPVWAVRALPASARAALFEAWPGLSGFTVPSLGSHRRSQRVAKYRALSNSLPLASRLLQASSCSKVSATSSLGVCRARFESPAMQGSNTAPAPMPAASASLGSTADLRGCQPNYPIERTCPGKPGHASHVVRWASRKE